MLIDEPKAIQDDADPLTSMMLNAIAGGQETRQLQKGVYLIGHFGSSAFLDGYEHYPDFSTAHGEYLGPYGVCDSLEQLLEKYLVLEGDQKRQFVVTLHHLRKSEQSSYGGWRWHKWGEYIGTQDPQCEYLYDEPVIEEVYVYHIYEKKV